MTVPSMKDSYVLKGTVPSLCGPTSDYVACRLFDNLLGSLEFDRRCISVPGRRGLSTNAFGPKRPGQCSIEPISGLQVCGAVDRQGHRRVPHSLESIELDLTVRSCDMAHFEHDQNAKDTCRFSDF